VVSPEHPYLERWADKIENMDEVRVYQEQAARKSDFERTEVAKDKTGVRLQGVAAVNPLTEKEIPIFISDYVLISYGTGAIMAVPGHDTRDWEFAKKFRLPIVEVVLGGDVSAAAFTDCETGTMVNSGIIDGLSVEDAKVKITAFLEEKGIGHAKTNYKLRDWIFSRQRYWGEPIPMVYCDDCGWVPVSEADLPLELPNVESYEPSENGESPLANMNEWIRTKCPCCSGKARRETDTMPQWAGSSWYFLRYLDPQNDNALASEKSLRYWLPIDWYDGGMEHTTLHLLYSRFWYKFLYDIGIVPTKEPYQKRTSHGFILGENSEKMSKSRGNVVNPDDIVREYGADTMRLYEMFIGDFEKDAPWNTTGVKGCRRFTDRYWALQKILSTEKGIRPDMETVFHRTIKKVGEDIESLKFNTAIAALMSLINDIYAKGSVTKDELSVFTILLSVFAPHVAEEVWSLCTLGKGMVAEQSWPVYDEAKCLSATVEIALQVSGKVRARIEIPANATQEEAIALARKNERIAAEIESKTVVKQFYVPGRLVNIVVR